MPRYIYKQRHKYSCAAVAVVNILKWCGVPVTYDHVLGLQSTGLWSFEDGSDVETLLEIIKAHDLQLLEVASKWSDLSDTLERHSVLLCVSEHECGESHAFLAITRKDGTVQLINEPRNWLIKRDECGILSLKKHINYIKFWEVWL